MTCPPSLLHWAQADNGRGSPTSFAFGGERRPNPWHQGSHTLYKVKNTPLFLATSSSWGLELRLAISRRAGHPVRAPHFVLPAKWLFYPSLITGRKALWSDTLSNTPRRCTPATQLGLDSSYLLWCFMEAMSAKSYYEQKSRHVAVCSSVCGWLGPQTLLHWETWHLTPNFLPRPIKCR